MEAMMTAKKVEKKVEPRFTGRFSVYDTPDNGIHIAWIPDGVEDSETQHIEIPGMIAGIMKRMASGEQINPAELMKMLPELMGALG
jgi:hypothetical protein